VLKFLILTLFSVPMLAFILDLLLGDPRRLPHPVRLIGIALDRLEPWARGLGVGPKAAGTLCVVLVAGLSYGCVLFLTELKWIGMLLLLYFAYAGLALGELIDSAKDALDAIEAGELDDAREAVGMLVTRSTEGMDALELRKTLAETVSENFNDGFVAPMFYLVLGGPALLWGYKAVSTMDSMWGYKNERYEQLGWAAAKADDLLAWVPARISAALLIIVGALLKLDWQGAKTHVSTDAAKMESPNAGWPMSACAWLLGGGMGGPALYFGEAKDKPILGPEGQEWTLEKLMTMFRLVVLSGFAGLLLLQALKVAVSFW
jgi:adenosylcobinamide-phosphate synthase